MSRKNISTTSSRGTRCGLQSSRVFLRTRSRSASSAGSSRRRATRPRPKRTARGAMAGTRRRGRFEQDPKYTWRNPGFAQTDDHPVVNVSWNDAVAFCEWLSRKEGQDVPAADRGGVGIRLPGRDDNAVFSGRRPGEAGAVGNVADGTAKAKFPDWTWRRSRRGTGTSSRPRWAGSEPNAFGPLRHARQCLGVVPGLVRRRILQASPAATRRSLRGRVPGVSWRELVRHPRSAGRRTATGSRRRTGQLPGFPRGPSSVRAVSRAWSVGWRGAGRSPRPDVPERKAEWRGRDSDAGR